MCDAIIRVNPETDHINHDPLGNTGQYEAEWDEQTMISSRSTDVAFEGFAPNALALAPGIVVREYPYEVTHVSLGTFVGIRRWFYMGAGRHTPPPY
jgi:hypothetical protein